MLPLKIISQDLILLLQLVKFCNKTEQLVFGRAVLLYEVADIAPKVFQQVVLVMCLLFNNLIVAI
jgi:hypothetical protein